MARLAADLVMWACVGFTVWNLYRTGKHIRGLERSSWRRGVLAAITHYERLEPDDDSREAAKIVEEMCGNLHVSRARLRDIERRFIERN